LPEYTSIPRRLVRNLPWTPLSVMPAARSERQDLSLLTRSRTSGILRVWVGPAATIRFSWCTGRE
jgi:hypothetical protein